MPPRRNMPARAILAALTLASLAVGSQPAPPPAPNADQLARDARMAWFRQARFGLFVHFGPFSQWYAHRADWGAFANPRPGESAQQFDRRFTEGITPARGSVRAWVQLARDAGMKYVVFTAKHHEGFCLWDSKLTAFNSVNLGPKFDMVREFVDACREFGLGAGIYYSLADGHHPDSQASPRDEAARRRFVDFTHALVRELMTRYGKIDMLWYDGPFPLGLPEQWESLRLNQMVRVLQPGIAINDRAMADGDFTCSENSIQDWIPSIRSDWEACLTFNGCWPYFPTPPQTYLSEKRILSLLQQCGSMRGNLLLGVGPNPAGGGVTAVEQQRLRTIGRWLKVYGQALYGHMDRTAELGMTDPHAGGWTRRGNTAWFWLFDWPAPGPLVIDNLPGKLTGCSLLPAGSPLPFTQTGRRLTITGLPKTCPDPILGVAILKLTFETLAPPPAKTALRRSE